MRVLMLSKACIVGIYQRKLEAIAHQGVDLLVLVPPAWKDERGLIPLERVYTEGYRLETTPIWFNGSYHLHCYPQFGRVLRDFQPDIVHIDEEPYNLASWWALRAARASGAKTLFFSWQNIARDYPPPFSWMERQVLNGVDYAIMGTASADSVWRDKGYSGPSAVIPQFGVDPDLFRPTATTEARPFTIGYFGRLVEEKGLLILLDAVARLDNPDWRLRLVGAGPLRPALETQAAALGITAHIEFCAQVPSSAMPARYQALDAFVLPSLTRPNWKEQFGRVLIEAMSSGVPVIGSASGAIPDVIGEAGLIVPEGDASALSAALARLRQDTALRQSLAEAGRARVLAHFTHEGVAQATVRVYEEIINMKKSAAKYSFEIRTARDFLSKLHDEVRDFKSNPLSSRHAINCAMTAWHLRDWVWALNKPQITSLGLGLKLDDFTEHLVKQCPELGYMQAMTNGSKHFRADRNNQIKSTKLRGGAFSRGFSRDFDISLLVIELDDGSSIIFDDVIETVVKFWDDFFSQFLQ